MFSRVILFVLILFQAHSSLSQEIKVDSFIDDRDQQSYSTVELLDGRIWMKDNLNFETKNSWCYDNDSSNCKNLGRLYTWSAVMDSCPKGWHVPSDDEWYNMLTKYGKISSQVIRDEKHSVVNYDLNEGKPAYEALIENGLSGFDAKFAGTYIIWPNDSVFKGIGTINKFWSITKHHNRDAVIYYSFSFNYKTVQRGYSPKENGMPCRCIKDE